MKKSLIIILTTLFFVSLIILFINSTFTPTQGEYVSQEKYVPNEVLVKFKKGTNMYFFQDAINSIQGKVITYRGEKIDPFQWNPEISSLRSFRSDPDLLHIKIPEFIGIEQAIYLLSSNPNVEYAEKNIIYSFDEDPPNDTHFNKLWGLENTGQTLGTVGADIDAINAWVSCTGRSSVVVAVMDSGVDWDHEDLATNMWTNPGEMGDGKETNNYDDDQNGYVDDAYGYDFYDAPDNYDPMDEADHGTHLAGIIGAKGDNGIGVTGVNWNITIMALRIAYSGVDVARAILAIEYAIQEGAKIINCSWGGPTEENSLRNAMRLAGEDHGILFICSAGNDTEDVDDPEFDPHYPACYDLDNIISVASTNNNDGLSNFSNYGSESIDLAAPGGQGTGAADTDDIYSTLIGDNYGYLRGTSMSTPYVTGAAALVWSKNSTLTHKQVKSKIMNSVDELPELSGKCVSEGRLNLSKAIASYKPSNLEGMPTAWTEIKILWQDNSDDETGFKIYKEEDEPPDEDDDIATVGSDVTSYKDQSCTAGESYYYKVSAISGCQNPSASELSDPINVTIPTGIPTAPSDLEAEGGTYPQSVDLFWEDNANNEQGVQIWRSEGSSYWIKIDTVALPNTVMYTDGNAPVGWVYYKVKAFNPTGPSPGSNIVEIYIPWN